MKLFQVDSLPLLLLSSDASSDASSSSSFQQQDQHDDFSEQQNTHQQQPQQDHEFEHEHDHDHYPKQLQYIPSHHLQQKDYFSGSFLVPRETFLKQLRPRHYVKLESASLETSSFGNGNQKAKMMQDWTSLAVEHFSHWWKTLYKLLEYTTITTTNDDHDAVKRLLMDRIVQIFKRYIQIQAPRQLRWNLQYHSKKRNERDHQQQQQRRHQEDHPMQRTIAAIAFQPYRLPQMEQEQQSKGQQSQVQNELEDLLTVHSLAATIASMVAAGFGRILVVGYHHHHHHPEQEQEQEKQAQKQESIPPFCVLEAFRLVQAAFPQNVILSTMDANDDAAEESADKKKGPGTQNGDITNSTTTTITSLGYAAITDETWVRNYRRKKLFNLQMGVVIGLQTALKGYMRHNMTRQQEWLGIQEKDDGGNDQNHKDHPHEYWKYVFLTEPDLLLHTKPWVLSLLQKGMDEEGLSYFPHRLQPLPHQADFEIMLLRIMNATSTRTKKKKNKNKKQDHNQQSSSSSSSLLYYSQLLPDDILPFSNITVLEYPMDSCCDDDSYFDNIQYAGAAGAGAGAGGESTSSSSSSLVLPYPGRSKEFGWRQHQVPCNDWWWTCGFVHNNNNHAGGKVPNAMDSIEKNAMHNNNNNSTPNNNNKNNNNNNSSKHLRLARYPMLRLQGGSGVVFGSTEQGRRCIPRKGPSCDG
ncbi:unnamed protein product [Cylindrotheca closterium]|uniref:Uncharacterized protein n=1 Tax=Cylindrotheca closterium TaxID=2856 RepID=A0AAD2CBX3_9STRA|nr:unnamed protein product [Cylindrotheca closterium]